VGPDVTPSVFKLNLATGAPDNAFTDPTSVRGATPAGPPSFTSLTLVGGQLYVGINSGISYRGTPADYLFSIDPVTGQLLEP
jgi:hypothetical protein